ncbi:hypothetical protein CEW81_10615 [Kluyvera genomosp. 3]|uniref:CopG family transcriptional regulator n=2 Tax=Kluyvera genomosp. 3 TaxID=2774055 RepID=A0A248KHH8_9ENTR|nr:hypothetical protein CEW81_10615 [Kluyvera genomosp. 3]
MRNLMNNTRTYPAKRRRRGEVQNASLTMLSARIADDLCEYVREVAFQTRKSKQQIITEALMLHQANGIETHE